MDGMVQPLEMRHLPYKRDRTYADYVSQRGLERLGQKLWRRAVAAVVSELSAAREPDDVVLGGGNMHLLEQRSAACRLGDNANAFLGGFRLRTDHDPAHPYP